MLSQYSTTVTCATCNNELYPQEAAKCRYLCGEELCPPTPKMEKFLDCRMRYFCSDECYRQYEEAPRSCNISRWDNFLQNVVDAAHPHKEPHKHG